MVTMYKKDRKYRKWKWNVSPSRVFHVYIVDVNGVRHHDNTFATRRLAQLRKKLIEADGGNAIIIGRA